MVRRPRRMNLGPSPRTRSLFRSEIEMPKYCAASATRRTFLGPVGDGDEAGFGADRFVLSVIRVTPLCQVWHPRGITRRGKKPEDEFSKSRRLFENCGRVIDYEPDARPDAPNARRSLSSHACMVSPGFGVKTDRFWNARQTF